MLLTSTSIHDLQSLLWLCEQYANKERYIIHPEKSVITPFVLGKVFNDFVIDNKPWLINNNQVTVSDTFTHLGIQRSSRNLTNAIHPTVVSRLSTARLTIHALMGVGLQMSHTLPPAVSLQIYNIYVLPRLTYGLLAINLRTVDIKSLEIQHRRFLYVMLHLPSQTSTASLHILTGILPLEAILDTQRLCYFHHLVTSDGTLREIVIRQWAMKDDNSYSWITTTRCLLRKYCLPDPLTILGMRLSKLQWKKLVKRNVDRVWSQFIEMEAIDKSTLQNCNIDFKSQRLHLSLLNLYTKFDIKRANIKWRILTGTYSTQSRRFTCKQIPSPNCIICAENEKEDLKHFILECPALDVERSHYLQCILRKIPHVFSYLNLLYSNTSFLLQFIIDHSHPCIQEKIPIMDEDIERATQQFLFSLHECRINKINAMNL
jgi:hypothetical protein